MRYGEHFCSRCQRNGCACPPVATYRSCCHDVPEGEPCAPCDDMRLADVPAPVRPEPADGSLCLDIPAPVVPALSRRRVLRAPEHEPGFVTLHDRAFERVALVPPEQARRIAVIDTALAALPALRAATEDLRAHWRETAEDREERAQTAGKGEHRDRLLAVAREARQSEALYAAVLGEDPGADVSHAPKVQPSEPPQETQ